MRARSSSRVICASSLILARGTAVREPTTGFCIGSAALTSVPAKQRLLRHPRFAAIPGSP